MYLVDDISDIIAGARHAGRNLELNTILQPRYGSELFRGVFIDPCGEIVVTGETTAYEEATDTVEGFHEVRDLIFNILRNVLPELEDEEYFDHDGHSLLGGSEVAEGRSVVFHNVPLPLFESSFILVNDGSGYVDIDS